MYAIRSYYGPVTASGGCPVLPGDSRLGGVFSPEPAMTDKPRVPAIEGWHTMGETPQLLRNNFV